MQQYHALWQYHAVWQYLIIQQQYHAQWHSHLVGVGVGEGVALDVELRRIRMS